MVALERPGALMAQDHLTRRGRWQRWGWAAGAHGGVRGEHIGHLTVISTQWMVAAAFFLVRAWRSQGWRWWALAALGIGLSAVTMLYYRAYLAPPLALVGVLLGTTWTKRRAQGALM